MLLAICFPIYFGCEYSGNIFYSINTFISFILMLLCMYALFMVGLRGMMATNSPYSPYNIFSINKKFTNVMKHSFKEAGMDCIELPKKD